MKFKNKNTYATKTILILLGGLVWLTGCGERKQNSERSITLFALTELDLTGELSDPGAEISGLCWYQDQLILLPQYPDRFAEHGRGAIFRIPKQRLLDYLDNRRSGSIRPEKIFINENLLTARIPGFQGFEAIVTTGNQVFITAESRQVDGMHAHLLKGIIKDDLTELVFEADDLITLELPVQIFNMSFESLLLAGDTLIALFELNGANVNPDPVALSIDLHDWSYKTIPFPAIEYRITDATELDTRDNFWVINYYWPGEYQLLQPAADSFNPAREADVTFDKVRAVERLLQLHYSKEKIRLAGIRPVILPVGDNGDGRNWEGLVRLDDRGFLIITDKHPATILAFVAVDLSAEGEAGY